MLFRSTAADSVRNRVKFGNDIDAAIRKVLVGPLIVDSVQVENIDFDDAYENSIRKLMEKEVEISTQRNETSKQISVNTMNVNKAKAEADSQLARATANASATRLQGEAEAYAIEVKAKALAANSNLVDLTKAEKWDGKLPTTMVPGSAVPFINVK